MELLGGCVLCQYNRDHMTESLQIFVDSIEKARFLAIYLQTFLLDKLKNRNKDIIKSFSLILETIIKTNWLEKFLIRDTRIIICIDAI